MEFAHDPFLSFSTVSISRRSSRRPGRRRGGSSAGNPETQFVFFNLGDRPAGKRLALAESAIAYARRTISDIELVPVSNVDPNQIPDFMNACNCLLLTSDFEGSPTVVKEALACNLPVITVDVGDVRDLLSGVEPSRIVADRVEALGDALIEVLRLDTRSDGASRAEELSERRTTDRVVEVFENAILPSVA